MKDNKLKQLIGRIRILKIKKEGRNYLFQKFLEKKIRRNMNRDT